MTWQLIFVCRKLDFDPWKVYKTLEPVLCKHTPGQIISLVEYFDPKGVHDWEYFLKIINNGYLPRKVNVDVRFDDEFWAVYEKVSLKCKPHEVSELVLLNNMRDDDRLKLALDYSDVLSEVYKVYKRMPRFNKPMEL
ncbi:MAG: hypothetical protein ACTSR2_01390 [Candidatus Hodarchaeales archaeon]